ncbi:TPA: TonB-dependent receptor [Pasteurella multocida]|uniref:TonB-dependent receptor plug domain-containing protein n=1 Tax=Pasteurella multocida TaxID=747 RepID=UPI002021DCA2|nr:TonB-dependent receptor plug domain-containing protein [Pasteurella multocida]MCL7835466.1 TonB-dependent receptor plug domain-containing protein [Pasteurella multocida]HDR1080978.1 TonB-dependent receptor [Pasteurella multocida]HDR1300635.1 TonB-dependent receptor [Pasteurella multocida]
MESAKNPLKKTTLALLCCSTAFSLSAKTDTNADKNHFLTEIVVYADQNKSMSSTQSVTQDDMKKSPVTNGNITDYLRSNPHVRYENSDQNGLQRGEIKPENISINGADTNQTAYFVDNVNVNNDLTIESELFDGAIQTLPGISHTQAYFFDADMLSKIEVQDSNVSASLGGFTGGAVIAKTKQYSGKNGIKLKYRTTNSSWGKFVENGDSKKVLNKVRPGLDGSTDLQPKYAKHNFSLVTEKGLTDNLGFVFGLSRRTSRIDQYRLIGFSTEAQLHQQAHTRSSDNALLNFNWTINDDNRLELSTRYSNYHEKKYSQTNVNSNVSDYHQAFGATLAWIRSLKSGVWANTLAYDRFKDKRHSSSNYVDTVSVMENYDVLYDYEKGGYGDSQLTQHNLHYSTEYAFEPFDLGSFTHSISLGGIYQFTRYKFSRPENVYSRIGAAELGNSNITWYPNLDNPKSDFSITYKGSAKTRYQNIALYIEDLISWKKLELRPGVRFERDDYLKNNNVAPRFVARFKPLEDTRISLGLNRYYGRSFASIKLTNEILKINRDTANIRDFQLSGRLKTPYADELSLNFEQEYRNLLFKLGYIHRENKNRIILKRKQINKSSRPEYAKYYSNTNNYSVDIHTLQINNIEPWQLGQTYWNASLGFDWLKTKRADLANSLNPNDPVYLDGRLMDRKTMQQKVNSNTEDWIARLGLNMAMPSWDLTWSNKVYIKAPIKGYDELDIMLPDDIPRFRTFDYGTHTQWDSSVRWQPKFAGKHNIYVQADILNVLNQTRKIRSVSISSTSEYSIYTPGREFWLEVGYEF